MPMPKSEEENLVYGIRLSSVVPGKMTGDGKICELKGIDLAMKLHYLKGVYFFANNNCTSETNSSGSFIGIHELKNHRMFDWLVTYFMACGRVRTSPGDGAPPVIKLNDAGIRIVEAQSSKTVDEWLAMDNFVSLHDHLVYPHVIGPDLGFTPLVFIQVTWFKCGGISVGLSWAHILGDVLSASAFMNMLGQCLQGHHKLPKTLALPKSLDPKYRTSNPSQQPLSIKRIDPVGECWAAPTNCKMGTHSFYLSSEQLSHLCSSIHNSNKGDEGAITRHFEVISAIIWKSLAKIRKDLDPKVVTVIRPKSLDREQVIPYNGQVIGTVDAKSSVSTKNVSDLVSLIVECMVDENEMVEEVVEREMNVHDFIIYGANFTIVDMEEADVYDFELKGRRPIFASYSIDGIGDEGAVFVQPGPSGGNNGGEGNKLVVLNLPENEIEPVKNELMKAWCIE